MIISPATAGDEGTYDVVVSNVVGIPIASAEVTLSVGSTAQIVAQPKSRVVTPGRSASFSVSAAGSGLLTYQWLFNGNPIQGATGASYQIDAAASGDIGEYKVVVANLAGEVTSNPVSLSFIDWAGTAGAFQGALVRANATDVGMIYPGRVTLTVAKTGKFTGKAEYLGLTHRFKGQFDLDLHSQVEVKRRNDSSLTLVLDLSGAVRAMTAEVTQVGELEPALADVPLIPKRPKFLPATRAGRYTMLLHPGPQAPSDLKGCAYFAFNVKPSGAVTWTGKLQDNTAVKGSAMLSPEDEIAFYSRLYLARMPYAGQLAAPLSVTENGVTGDVGWRKPAQPKVGIWSSGLSAILETESSPWVASSFPLIAPGSRTFRLESPFDTTEDFSAEFISTGKFVFSANSKKLKLSVNRTTGELSGSYFDLFAGRNKPFRGVMLQTQNKGEGFVPGTLKIQAWELLPPAP